MVITGSVGNSDPTKSAEDVSDGYSTMVVTGPVASSDPTTAGPAAERDYSTMVMTGLVASSDPTKTDGEKAADRDYSTMVVSGVVGSSDPTKSTMSAMSGPVANSDPSQQAQRHDGASVGHRTLPAGRLVYLLDEEDEPSEHEEWEVEVWDVSFTVSCMLGGVADSFLCMFVHVCVFVRVGVFVPEYPFFAYPVIFTHSCMPFCACPRVQHVQHGGQTLRLEDISKQVGPHLDVSCCVTGAG